MLAWNARHDIPEPVDAGELSGILLAAIDAGLATRSSGGMGGAMFAPLSWQEISAWVDLMQPQLSRYELQLMRRVSAEYADELMLMDSKDHRGKVRPDVRLGGDPSKIVPISDEAILRALGI